jgi:hypothetical protein
MCSRVGVTCGKCGGGEKKIRTILRGLGQSGRPHCLVAQVFVPKKCKGFPQICRAKIRKPGFLEIFWRARAQLDPGGGLRLTGDIVV